MRIHHPSSENKIRKGASVDLGLCALNGLPEKSLTVIDESKNRFHADGLQGNKDL